MGTVLGRRRCVDCSILKTIAASETDQRYEYQCELTYIALH